MLITGKNLDTFYENGKIKILRDNAVYSITDDKKDMKYENINSKEYFYKIIDKKIFAIKRKELFIKNNDFYKKIMNFSNKKLEKSDDFYYFDGEIYFIERIDDSFCLKNDEKSLLENLNVNFYIFKGFYLYFATENSLFSYNLKNNEIFEILEKKSIVSFDISNNFIVLSDNSNKIFIYDKNTKKCLDFYHWHSNKVINLIIDPSETFILSTCDNRTVLRYDFKIFKKIFLFEYEGNFISIRIHGLYFVVLTDIFVYLYGRDTGMLESVFYTLGKINKFLLLDTSKTKPLEKKVGKDILNLKKNETKIIFENILNKDFYIKETKERQKLIFYKKNMVMFYDLESKKISKIFKVKNQIENIFLSKFYLFLLFLEKRENERNFYVVKKYKILENSFEEVNEFLIIFSNKIQNIYTDKFNNLYFRCKNMLYRLDASNVHFFVSDSIKAVFDIENYLLLAENERFRDLSSDKFNYDGNKYSFCKKFKFLNGKVYFIVKDTIYSFNFEEEITIPLLCVANIKDYYISEDEKIYLIFQEKKIIKIFEKVEDKCVSMKYVCNKEIRTDEEIHSFVTEKYLLNRRKELIFIENKL
ncbi:hypothetical protein CWI38_0255p0020 [Hamiltosporidium tvaerminnensis]|uniref:WD40 domain-containing protein n=1 Tax=Hamiltosporidium tvaerminnensis TaxID=1176355 RepID=A0A4V2JY26_9MICR|nr:hypothetical protein CWI38_0255p0020 [Hamiltosporidium tvaerminnensis]